MLRSKLLAIALVLASVCSVTAQKFLPPVETFSGKSFALTGLEGVRNNDIEIGHTRTARGFAERDGLCLVADDFDPVEREHLYEGYGSKGGLEPVLVTAPWKSAGR